MASGHARGKESEKSRNENRTDGSIWIEREKEKKRDWNRLCLKGRRTGPMRRGGKREGKQPHMTCKKGKEARKQKLKERSRWHIGDRCFFFFFFFFFPLSPLSSLRLCRGVFFSLSPTPRASVAAAPVCLWFRSLAFFVPTQLIVQECDSKSRTDTIASEALTRAAHEAKSDLALVLLHDAPANQLCVALARRNRAS